MNKDEQLLTALTLYQIYLEQLKVNYSKEFGNVLVALNKDIRLLFVDIEEDNLGDLTKSQLRVLIKDLRKIQDDVYSNYSVSFTTKLKAFVAAAVEVKRLIFETDGNKTTEEAYSDKDGEPMLGIKALSDDEEGNALLFSLIKNTPIPANGVLPFKFVSGFTAVASLAIENEVIKGYANRSTKSEVLRIIKGSKAKRYSDGVLAKLSRQHKGMSSTTIQHASSITQAGIASVFYKRYIWNSIIDGATTDICRSREGNKYVFGKGPLPPAHVGCRSSIFPYSTKPSATIVGMNYFTFLKSQPAKVQNDILSKRDAKGLQDGSLGASYFKKFVPSKAMNVEQLKKKFIL